MVGDSEEADEAESPIVEAEEVKEAKSGTERVDEVESSSLELEFVSEDKEVTSDGSRDLTQQDGWKTQDGRMTEKCGARLCIPGLARHFIRYSAVLSLPAVLLRKVSSFRNDDGNDNATNQWFDWSNAGK